MGVPKQFGTPIAEPVDSEDDVPEGSLAGSDHTITQGFSYFFKRFVSPICLRMGDSLFLFVKPNFANWALQIKPNCFVGFEMGTLPGEGRCDAHVVWYF